MTLTILRSLGTVLAFVAFIGIFLWAYSKKRRAAFDEAANLPFADEAISEASALNDAEPSLSSEESQLSRKENAS